MARKRRPVETRAQDNESQREAVGAPAAGANTARSEGTESAGDPAVAQGPASVMPLGLTDRWALFQAALIAAVFLLNVYRAAVQSVTYDEAYSYLWYAHNSWQSIFIGYLANNHILHSVLIKLMCDLFGASQLGLRLPSLLAGLLFLISAMRLSRLLTPRSHVAATLAFLALSINPLILDYLSMARGYSLALALFSFAMLVAFDLVSGAMPRARQFVFLGVSLGLSVSANLTFLFPSAALFLVVALMFGIRGRTTPVSRMRFWLDLVRYGAVPACLVAGSFLYLPLSSAKKDNFYQGVPTLTDSVNSLVNSSLDHHPDNFGTYTHSFPVVVYAAESALILTLIAAVWLLVRAIRSRQPPGAAAGRFLFLQLCVDFMVLFPLAAHWITGVPFPGARTGLYLVFCFTLMGVSLLELAMRLSRWYWTGCCIAGLALLVAQFVSQLSTAYYACWRYDASTKQAFEAIRTMSLAHPEHKNRISYSCVYGQTLEFYRQVWAPLNIEPVEGIGSDSTTPLSGYDYYVLDDHDLSRARAAGLVPVLYYDLSHTTIAIPAPQKPF
jgi:hypothetical protein